MDDDFVKRLMKKYALSRVMCSFFDAQLPRSRVVSFATELVLSAMTATFAHLKCFALLTCRHERCWEAEN